jgi:uncharacterized protein (DUF362 family)
MKEVVSVVSCNSYNQKEIDKAIEKSLKEINFKIKPNSKILIKPNLVSNNLPQQHSVTHYTLIDFLCRYFLKNKCKVTIGESSAFYIKGYTNDAYKSSRIYDVAKKYSIPLVAFEDEKIIPVEKKNLKFLKELYIPKVINEFDLIVDVPKLKTHKLMRFSGAVKNLYGIVPGGYKQILHTKTKNINEMAEVILDLYQNLKPPILSVIDGVVGLDGGPSAVVGRPKKVGYILSSMNPFALDVIACQMIGYSPKDLPLITMAEKRRLFKIKDVKQIGKFEKVIFSDLKKGAIVNKKKDSLLVTKTYAYPKITSKCDLCKVCISACPTKALELKNDKIILNDKKCIHCYSCVASCPEKAIKLKEQGTGKLFNIVRRIFRI